jgi:hypothetical protein
MVTRAALLAVACVLILGGVWLFTGTGRHAESAAQFPAPAAKPAAKPAPVPSAPKTIETSSDKTDSNVAKEVEPSDPPKDNKVPEPKEPEPAKPPKDAKPPHLIEVDLSKLPPDLVKQLQGAIVERRKPKAEPKPKPEPAPER